MIRLRRSEDLELVIGADKVLLRNQEPLVEANLSLEEGWTFADLVGYLNEHVFFWPGTSAALDALGKSFLSRYEGGTGGILRIRLARAGRTNPSVPPLFSRYNSGAGRFSGGKPSPRGPATFVIASRFKGTKSQVKEVAFRGAVALPPDTEIAPRLSGPWRRAFPDAS